MVRRWQLLWSKKARCFVLRTDSTIPVKEDGTVRAFFRGA